jgi:N-acyl-L-homoserine lactone synthetase
MTDLDVQHGRPYSVHAQCEQALPFRVRLAKNEIDLRQAVAVRIQAYGRHVPGMDAVLKEPEPDDFRDDAALLIAESKETGQVLGSMRLLTNATQALHLEHEVELPAMFHGKRLLEAWRLTVRNCEEGRLVAAALYKSLYEISFHAGIDHILVVARKPVDRLYKAMQFKDGLQGRKLALSNTLNLPHGLFYLPVREADTLWREAECPLYPFMALTSHPDIEIDHEEIRQRFEHSLSSQTIQFSAAA